MSRSNHYKSQIPEEGEPQKERKAPRKKNAEPSKPGAFDRIRKFLKDERTRQITGLCLILLSAVMLVSMTSFLFTWDNDNEIEDMSFWEILTSPNPEIRNWLGNFGAALSHILITKAFGLASFAFVLITFLLGFRVLFGIHLLPFWRTTAYSLFILTWTSIALGAILGGISPNFGGVFGYYGSLWLKSLVGAVGTYGLLFFSALIFSMVNFNLSLTPLLNLFKKREKAPEAPEAEPVVPLPDNGPVEVSFDEAPAEPEPEAPIEPEAAEQPLTEDIALDLVPTPLEVLPEPPVSDEGDLALHIEEPPAEEAVDEEEMTTVEALADYDPMLDLSRYQFPPIDLLKDHGDGNIQVERDELERNKNRIVDTLKNYNIGIAKITATIGPTVTLYEIVPEAGVRISKIKNLEDDIALSLAALGIRIIAPIPGKGTIGIEVPNQTPDVVSMRTVIQSEKFQASKMDLPVALGKTISNETFVTDLCKMPHLLMAGATGQGKSVGLNCILASLLYKKHPAQVKFVLVDPKKVELTLFNKIERHFLAKLPGEEEAIITDTSKVVNTLNSLCIEMDERYELLKNAQCRNLKEYNAKFVKRKLNPNNGHRYLPYIVLVVDEFADLIMTAGKEVELPIARLAQLARAIGIHLIIATQRPSVNIITGTIKANFPTRIAFRVTSKIDSRTILDAGGAEQLIGRGDMLFSNGNDLIRLQCAFVDTPEIEDIVNFIGEQQGYPDAHLLPEYVPEGGEGGTEDFDSMERDSMFNDAARMVVIHQQGSASLLQRKLKLGYNRAGRIVDQLEAAGIIGPFEGSKARQVLIADEVSLERHLKALDEKNNPV